MSSQPVPCYDGGNPQHCAPNSENVTIGRTVTSSSTCGTPREWFCGREKSSNLSDHEYHGVICGWCDAKDPNRSHPVAYLTDGNDPYDVTWWQSSKDHDEVSLTLSLGKSFEITSVSLHFFTQIPEATGIYKSLNFGETWMPFQFYSIDCYWFYKLSSRTVVSTDNVQETLCSNPGVRPFRGGPVKFDTLEGRPSASDLDASPALQDWVTATDIRVVFQRGDPGLTFPFYPKHKRSAFFSATDFQVEGRCKCNGHASHCVTGTGGRLECDCEHNTAGPDCGRCRHFHRDRPWKRATPRDPHQCIACKCNEHSHLCEFSRRLYEKSGQRSGGRCIGCRHNTFGSQCHLCARGFYRDQLKEMTHRNACQRCTCNPVGSRSKMCDGVTGRCICKDGVEGGTCSRCVEGYQHGKCSEYCTPQNPLKLDFKVFCERDIALEMRVLEEDMNPDWTLYKVVLQDVWWSHMTGLSRGLHVYLAFLNQQLLCSCPPELNLGSSDRYLVLGSGNNLTLTPGQEQHILTFGVDTVILPWHKMWSRLLKSFKRVECI
uniref:netrin-1-like n=1 Tax=Myxine glutinosa TaxID=7769 RepID=UPI00358F4700